MLPGLCAVLALPVRADLAAGLAAYQRGDYAAAVQEFAAEAERGDARAQNLLGLSYALGQGVPANPAEAIRLFRLSGTQGYDEAQFNLGTLYSKGQGTGVDFSEAARWFKMAAEQGNARAQLNLGVLYYNGQGVKRDPVQALMWLQLASARGNGSATALRDGLLKSMSREQVEQAERLTATWNAARHPVQRNSKPPVVMSADQHHRRGRELSRAGKFRLAVDELSEAIRLKPGDPKAHNARGFAYLKLKDYGKAIADFSEAIRLDPGYANAYRNRAAARKLTGDAAGAAEDLKKAG